ncbi:MAG: hypothetical protein HY808_14525 [Nitrospirae bacterium]|nr:hypothetical protein [Nitrospirota bacterium]
MSVKIISVTGAHSGVGKTTLCSILLENLKGFGAIKFTRTELYTTVTDDEIILKEKGKDTAIFFESGAERVVWIQSPGGRELEDALNVSLTKMTGLEGVVVEGNSPADLLKPLLTIFIIGGDGEIKPFALEVGKKADIIIINSETDIENPASLIPFPQEHAKFFRIDLINKRGEIDKLLAYIQKYIV